MERKRRATTNSDDPGRAVRDAALRLLARREYAAGELRRKLGERGFPAELVARVVAELGVDGLQSDRRFIESLLATRSERGHGPLRVGRDLRERGVDRELIDAFLDPDDADWIERARQVARRRFGPEPPEDYAQWAQRARFLQSRGFTERQVRAALGDGED
jgi:regulatory protein